MGIPIIKVIIECHNGNNNTRKADLYIEMRPLSWCLGFAPVLLSPTVTALCVLHCPLPNKSRGSFHLQ